jgi:DNA-binding NarL/FixJ family response regulator
MTAQLARIAALRSGTSAPLPASPGTGSHVIPSADPVLTDREVEVLLALADGASNQQIATRLVISVHTVERHLANIYRKIGARGRADATRYALRHLPD